jgi:hypothetical protein
VEQNTGDWLDTKDGVAIWFPGFFLGISAPFAEPRLGGALLADVYLLAYRSAKTECRRTRFSTHSP